MFLGLVAFAAFFSVCCVGKGAGFKTAFVRRPDEWDAAGPPDPEPNAQHDIIVDGFPDLAAALGVAL